MIIDVYYPHGLLPPSTVVPSLGVDHIFGIDKFRVVLKSAKEEIKEQ